MIETAESEWTMGHFISKLQEIYGDSIGVNNEHFEMFYTKTDPAIVFLKVDNKIVIKVIPWEDKSKFPWFQLGSPVANCSDAEMQELGLPSNELLVDFYPPPDTSENYMLGISFLLHQIEILLGMILRINLENNT